MTKIDMKKYKGILFDLDGTLVDSLDIWLGADIETLKHFGAMPCENFPQEKDKFFHAGQDAPNIYDIFYQYCINLHNLKNVNVDEYRQKCEQIAFEKLKYIDFKQGAGELLNTLKPSHKLSLVTISTNKALDVLLNKNKVLKKTANIKEIFGENIITADMITNKKPDPEAYTVAVDKLGLKPRECLVFEDSLTGVIASTSAKLDTCVVHDKHSDEHRDILRLLTPYHINSFNEISETL